MQEREDTAPIIIPSFRVWFLFFVGDPFTVERALEKLRAMPDREEAKKILKKVKRNSLFREEFRRARL